MWETYVWTLKSMVTEFAPIVLAVATVAGAVFAVVMAVRFVVLRLQRRRA